MDLTECVCLRSWHWCSHQ